MSYIVENIALNKTAWQLHPYENPFFLEFLNANNAIDGLKTNLSFFGGQCTISANRQIKAMWSVDLGDVLGINHITIYYRTDNMPWSKFQWCSYLFKKHFSNTHATRKIYNVLFINFIYCLIFLSV